MVSQLFLGVRLECAKCHHHPFESGGRRSSTSSPPTSPGSVARGPGSRRRSPGARRSSSPRNPASVKHPLTGEVLPPKPLFGAAPLDDDPDADPREALARWMTAPDNPYFARVIANRVWADLMGRGIVEPVDDLRATNPPSNGPLLDALADDFRTPRVRPQAPDPHDHDLDGLRAQLEPNERNVADTRNYSRHYRQRLRAEMLLDAISDVTGVPDVFAAAPPGSRASTIWTTRVPSLFLDTFGRPDPNQDPPCERTSDTAVVQALHLMNSPGAAREDRRPTTAASRRWPRATRRPQAIVEELYLLAYSRHPSDEETSVCETLFEEPRAIADGAVEDVLWALLNSPEFVFKD